MEAFNKGKGYSKVAGAATDVPLEDVAAAVEPTVYPEGTVSVAWKRAFFALLAAVLLTVGAFALFGHPPPPREVDDLLLRDDVYGDDHHRGPHRKMGPGGHHGHHGRHHHADAGAMESSYGRDMEPRAFEFRVDADFEMDFEEPGHQQESRKMAGAKSFFHTWHNWAAAKAGADEASTEDDDDCKQDFIALKKRCAAAIEEVKKEVKAGKLKEEAKEKIEAIEEGCKARGEALAKKCSAGEGGWCKVAFKKLRYGCAEMLKATKEAAAAGKITPEEAKKKIAAIEAGCKVKAEALKKKCGKEEAEAEEPSEEAI